MDWWLHWLGRRPCPVPDAAAARICLTKRPPMNPNKSAPPATRKPLPSVGVAQAVTAVSPGLSLYRAVSGH